MADPQEILAQRVQRALVAAFGEEEAGTDAVIRPSQFADYQSNVALALGKRHGRPPRVVAAELAEQLDVGDICVATEVSGPGFINFSLREDWIASQADLLLTDERLGIPASARPQTIVVEYSSPNVAKEMHVGHLRTTIVGDSIARVMDVLGHRVIRDNHVGDWGTPYGMLIEHLLEVGEHSAQAGLLETDPNTFYQAARQKFDADPAFAERARERVVLLQGGDAETIRLWQELVDLSREYLRRTYARLGVTLTDADIRGESFYNDLLAGTVAELAAKGIAVESHGALCAFPPGFTGREGEPLPVIIRKSDGAYNYSTTDLAAIRYRVDQLHVERAIYVVGASQALHFQMVFAVARQAGWIPEGARFEHAQIGDVLGPDGKILRTRAGKSIKLREFLDEAVERAGQVIADRYEDPQVRAQIAAAVGIGALKYADLSVARDSGYVFDFDRMLALTGNTAPYLQYAAARIRSIFRRDDSDADKAAGPMILHEHAERALALRLLDFGTAVQQVGETAEPHRLCAYLFGVASAFTTFYEQCPVLGAPSEAVKESRLALSALTLRVLLTGLGLLGVQVPDRM
ncbi:MAG TPA: arginine--tRNA ligase [Streptosporangiaceae bacterium]|nr:arginine--tRNA ligase [Streptosporangiaceae bacterium]